MRFISLMLVNAYFAVFIRSSWFLGTSLRSIAFVQSTSSNTFVDWGAPHPSSFSLLSCLCVEFSSDPVGQEPGAHFCHSWGVSVPCGGPALSTACRDVICQNSNRLLALSLEAEPWCIALHSNTSSTGQLRMLASCYQLWNIFSCWESLRKG